MLEIIMKAARWAACYSSFWPFAASNQFLQIGEAVSAMCFKRVGLANKEAIIGTGWNAYSGIWPSVEVILDLLEVSGSTPACTVAKPCCLVWSLGDDIGRKNRHAPNIG